MGKPPRCPPKHDRQDQPCNQGKHVRCRMIPAIKQKSPWAESKNDIAAKLPVLKKSHGLNLNPGIIENLIGRASLPGHELRQGEKQRACRGQPPGQKLSASHLFGRIHSVNQTEFLFPTSESNAVKSATGNSKAPAIVCLPANPPFLFFGNGLHTAAANRRMLRIGTHIRFPTPAAFTFLAIGINMTESELESCFS